MRKQWQYFECHLIFDVYVMQDMWRVDVWKLLHKFQIRAVEEDLSLPAAGKQRSSQSRDRKLEVSKNLFHILSWFWSLDYSHISWNATTRLILTSLNVIQNAQFKGCHIQNRKSHPINLNLPHIIGWNPMPLLESLLRLRRYVSLVMNVFFFLT